MGRIVFDRLPWRLGRKGPGKGMPLWQGIAIFLLLALTFLFLWHGWVERYIAQLDPFTVGYVYLARGIFMTLVTVAFITFLATRKEKELRVTKDYLQSILDSSMDGIVTTDLQGKVTFLNRAAVDMLGYGAQEVTGRPMRTLYRGGVESAKKIMAQLMEEGRIRDEEMEMVAKDGRTVVVKMSACLLKDSEGNPIGTLGVSEDITHLKQLERRMEESERMATVGQLAAWMAHEAGTPLNIISGYAEYLLADTKDKAKREELRVIVDQAERIGRMIKQLLRYARPSSPQVQPVDVNGLLSDVVRLLVGQSGEGKIGVVTELAPDIPAIPLDPDQLQQVFVNIMVNAFQAMPDGGKLTVSTGIPLSGENRWLEVRFADMGCGIPAENMDKIFEPFFSTKGVGKGTGLGLAVSRRIVEDHGGRITVESDPEGGSTFTVLLPLPSKEEFKWRPRPRS